MRCARAPRDGWPDATLIAINLNIDMVAPPNHKAMDAGLAKLLWLGNHRQR